MDLVTPAIGLIFWTGFIFLLLLLLLTIFAWKPIVNAVNSRNRSIEDALNAADNAKEEMVKLQANNEQILKEARMDREKILKEAREIKDKIISEAKEQSKIEADKILISAKNAIENEKRSAINEMKNQMATLSIEIAEKILQKELSDKKNQKTLIDDLLKNTNIN